LSLYMRKEQKNSISHLLDSLGFNNKEVVWWFTYDYIYK
jgi:hypothetical protein